MQNFGEFSLKVAESGDPSDMMAYTTAETAAVDAALKQVRSQAYAADAGRVSKSGDTMTGALKIRVWGGSAQLLLQNPGNQVWAVEVTDTNRFRINRVGTSLPAAVDIDANNQIALGGHVTVGTDLTVSRDLFLPKYGAGSGALDPKFLMIDNVNGHVSGLNLQGTKLILGITTSSRRFKTAIADAPSVPDVAALQPAVFRWNDETVQINGDRREHLGLIAEDVAAVDPRFATYDGEGHPDGLDVAALIAALVDKCQKLEARIAQLEAS